MEIRRAHIDDSFAVAKVQVDTWHTTYTNIIPDEYLAQMTYENREKQWMEIITNQDVFVAENNQGQIVGFSNGGIERTGNYPEYTGELYAIYILEEYQGKGIGKLLLEPLIESLINKGIYSMTVSVLMENKARLFYEHLGATKLDCVKLKVMEKELEEVIYGWEDIRKI